jgi:hypothetical protein
LAERNGFSGHVPLDDGDKGVAGVISFSDPNGLAQRLRFRFEEWLTGYAHERHAFQSRQGYPLDLTNPRSFSEKICWRKIYDRNPLLPCVIDKYAVRKYVVDTLGERRAHSGRHHASREQQISPC